MISLQLFVRSRCRGAKNYSYDFTVCGHNVYCREYYADADGALAHMARVHEALEQVSKFSKTVRLALHGD